MFKAINLTAAGAAIATAGLLATPVLAGSENDVAPDPVVVSPARYPDSSPDWTGFYLGGQIGYVDGDADREGDDEDVIGGVVGGYDYDFGQWVVGAGIDYDFSDLSFGGSNATLDEIFRLKVRGGYKIGKGLLYATGGYAQADGDSLDDDDGYFIGGGYEYRVSDSLSIGTEVLYHEFDDSVGGTSADLEVTTVQLRATFRF